jgi:hypothetical protein
MQQVVLEKIHKAASAVAAAVADGKQPEDSWTQAVAWLLQQGNPTERKAFQAFLRDFGQPRLLRLVSQSRISNEDGEIPVCPDPPGEILTLFKHPLPGETQARLAYACFQDGFLAYLKRTRCVCPIRETSAHVTLFVPSARSLDLEETWQGYMAYAFSSQGLSESLILLLNSVQLARRGVGVLDVPIVSKDQKQILTGFYLAAIRQVERRLHWRDGQIRESAKRGTSKSLTAREKEQSAKTIKKLQDKQQEEIEKYRSAFAKSLSGVLTKEEKLLQKITEKKTSGAKPRAEFSGKPREDAFFTFRKEQLQPMRDLLNATKGNPFRFIEKDKAARPDIFYPAIRLAARFTERAGNQLATAVGAKFAGVMLEAYWLLDGDVPLTRIPAIFSAGTLSLAERPPGDASGEWCYSCGVVLRKKDPAYEVRRLLFSSPDQRPQSSASSIRPKACATCAAIALTCPLKISDQTVIVRLDPQRETLGAADYVRDYCRMLTIGTLNTAAGRYLSLVCTERTAKGVLASARIGQVVYAIAKLGLELPADVFRDFRLTLIIEGSEIRLDSPVLFAAAGFLRGYRQRIIVGGNLNTTLGQAVRYIQAGVFYAAEYTIIANGAPFHDEISLENHRKELWEFLKKSEEEGMTRNGEQRAKFYGDVAALSGLLYGFCAALRTKIRQDPEQAEKDIGRILGKAIEYVDDSPAFFTYTAITNKLPSEDARLYKDPRHHFLYDRVKSLLTELKLDDREKQEETSSYLQLYFDDITGAYTHFSQRPDYKGGREWKEFLYQVKLSLYSRFPECFASTENTRR